MEILDAVTQCCGTAVGKLQPLGLGRENIKCKVVHHLPTTARSHERVQLRAVLG